MLFKIKRDDFLVRYPDFPQSDYRKDIYIFPPTVGLYILVCQAKSNKGLAKNLGIEASDLFMRLGIEKVFFMGDTKTPWLYQDNEYGPVKSALTYLVQNKVGKHFNGAFEFSIAELPEFLRHLFWLIRCNAALPYIQFGDPERNFIASICKYGNLHLHTLNDKADFIFNDIIEKTKFEISGDGRCFDRFSKWNKINNRQTVV